MKKIFLLFYVFMFWKVEAQDCGTVPTSDQLDFMSKIKAKITSNSRTQNVLVDIPIKFHSVRRDDGTGGITASQANSILDQLNGYFSSASISFFLVDGTVNYIDDTDQFNFDSSNEGAVAVGNDIRGTINVYFFNSIVSGGTPLCGYTRFPPSSDRVFVAYNCVIGETTLEHELGHYFTLFHTHGTTNTGTTDELVDGSNCESAGDRLCDTPADPNLSGVVNSSCIYIGTATDANGDFFNPQVENIMAYSPDQCQDLFTSGQYQRIRNGFEQGRIYLNWQSDDFTANFTSDLNEICIDSEVDFEGLGFGVTSWFWEFEGGSPATSQTQNPTVSYSSAGSFDVRLTVTNNSGAEVVVNKNNFIKVIDPLNGARSDTLNMPFDNDISTLSIENNDEGITFDKSSVDRNNDLNSGSIFINNFDYFSEAPGNIDIFTPGNYDNEGVYKYLISFDYAYTFRPSDVQDLFIYDSLELVFNTGCLESDVSLWKSGGRNLATATETNDPFVPDNSTQWRSASIEYQLDGSESAIFKFKSISYNGNNLYIDNLKITPDLFVPEPSLFRIVGMNNQGLTIRWVDESFNELGFTLQKSVNNGSYVNIDIERDKQIYIDDEVSAEGSYSYKIFAKGRNGVTSDTLGPITFDNTITSLVLDEDNSDQNKIKIYPNPAENIIKVESIVGEQVLSIELVDQMGRIVIKQSVNGFGTDLNVSNVQAGMYFVQLNFKNKSITKRVVIKK